jgi:hypothetical protein
MPKKLSDVSAIIIPGIDNVKTAIIWLINEGTMCRKITLNLLVPYSTAAVTKSSCLMDKNLPRTSRARVVQPIKEIMTVMAKYIFTTLQSRGKTADNPIQSGRVGIDLKNSIIRCIKLSVNPELKPEIPPMRIPKKKLIATPTNPMDIDTLVP